jgi:hypothetical protein
MRAGNIHAARRNEAPLPIRGVCSVGCRYCQALRAVPRSRPPDRAMTRALASVAAWLLSLVDVVFSQVVLVLPSIVVRWDQGSAGARDIDVTSS